MTKRLSLTNTTIYTKRYSNQGVHTLAFVVALIFLFAGSALELSALKIVGLGISFFIVLFGDVLTSFFFLAFLTPNLAVFSYTNYGTGLLGLAYILLFLRCFLTAKRPKCLSEKSILLMSIILLFGFARILQGITHDLLLFVQVICAIYVWKYFIKFYDKSDKYTLYKYFGYGVLALLFGMVVQYFTIGRSDNRFTGLLDDPNYTAASFAVLASLSVYLIFNKVKTKQVFFFLVVGMLGGLLTASRGFLLSIGMVAICYVLYALKNRRARIVFFYLLLVIALFVVLYVFKFGPVVSLYDKTIGRTLELQNNYSAGKFMDITSGRLVLWSFYWDELKIHPIMFAFGRGFENYYLVENGGYGLAAHNSFISGLMGFGLFGLITILSLYFEMCRFHKKSIIDFSIIVCFLTAYMFLDGLLDLRLILYFALFEVVTTQFIKKKMHKKLSTSY